jgi:hypothetical protein
MIHDVLGVYIANMYKHAIRPFLVYINTHRRKETGQDLLKTKPKKVWNKSLFQWLFSPVTICSSNFKKGVPQKTSRWPLRVCVWLNDIKRERNIAIQIATFCNMRSTLAVLQE